MGRSPAPTSGDENNIRKGAWTPEEDQQLINYIQNHGHGSWRALPKHAGQSLIPLALYLSIILTFLIY